MKEPWKSKRCAGCKFWAKITGWRGFKVTRYCAYSSVKCIGGAIVTAHIPDSALVRGSKGEKCRASKAEIISVDGGFDGIAVSKYDLSTSYAAGDTVIVDDFDFSNGECGAGFHFSCTREEAERY